MYDTTPQISLVWSKTWVSLFDKGFPENLLCSQGGDALSWDMGHVSDGKERVGTPRGCTLQAFVWVCLCGRVQVLWQ